VSVPLSGLGQAVRVVQLVVVGHVDVLTDQGMRQIVVGPSG
jgi:hypothetical protein